MSKLYPGQTTIYGLCDPRTGDLRYVGKSDDPQKRLRAHIIESVGRNSCHRHHWIKGLVDRGLRPDVIVLEVVRRQDWEDAERFWIAAMRLAGCDLVNGSDGGEGNKNCRLSDLTRQRMSEAHKGKSPSETHRQALSKALRGRIFTEASREKMRMAHKGQKLPPGHPWLEDKGGEANPFYGRQHTAETRAKISAAKTGLPSPKKGLPAPTSCWDYRLKTYILTAPDGTEHVVGHLAKFCEEHGLNRSNLLGNLAGRGKTTKGWRIRRPD